MKLSTKNLASLLVLAVVASAVPGISSLPRSRQKKQSQFDRILQRHDRKGELRAALLGVEPHIFRSLQRKMPLEEVITRYGFSDTRHFRMALCGKLRDELRQRGWSARRIDRLVALKGARLS